MEDKILITKEEYNRLKLCELQCCEPPTYICVEQIEQEIVDKYNKKLQEHYADQHEELKARVTRDVAEMFVKQANKHKQVLMNPYTDDEFECVSVFWIHLLAENLGVKMDK